MHGVLDLDRRHNRAGAADRQATERMEQIQKRVIRTIIRGISLKRASGHLDEASLGFMCCRWPHWCWRIVYQCGKASGDHLIIDSKDRSVVAQVTPCR